MQKSKIDSLPIVADAAVSQELLAKAVADPRFKAWLESVDDRYLVKTVRVQNVDMFGPVKVGFIKFSADVVDSLAQGDKVKNLPGIVFMRGGAVAIVMALKCKGKLKTILTVQPRIASGRFNFRECPAGMLDGETSNFAGTAAKELKEELGMVVTADELIDLTSHFGMPNGIFPSPGGSDETIRIFAVEREISEEELATYEGKATGALDEGEQITLEIADFDALLTLDDAKSIIGHGLYTRWAAEKAA